MRREPDEGERELGAWLATKRAEEEAALAEAAAELTRHRLFMEAAAVETAAMIWWEQYRQGDLPNRRSWSWCAPSQRDYARECARIEIEGQLRRRPPVIAAIEAAKAESMETRHDG